VKQVREECLKTASAMNCLSSASPSRRISLGANKMQRLARAQPEEEREEKGCMDFEDDCDSKASNKQCFKVD